MNNIIQTYYDYLTNYGLTLDDVIDAINDDLNRKMDENYFSHLKCGSKTANRELHRYLLDDVIEYQAKRFGYRDLDKFKRAVDGLMVPRGRK